MPMTPTFQSDGGGKAKKKRPNESSSKGFAPVDKAAPKRPFMPVSNAASEAGRGYFGPNNPVPQGPTPPANFTPSTSRPAPSTYQGPVAPVSNTVGGDDPGSAGGASTPSSGFAAQFTPSGRAGLYNDPELMAAEVLKSMGIDNPEMVAMLSQNADLAQAIGFLMGYGGQGSDIPTLSDQVNWGSDYLTGLMTPGAADYDANQLMDLLLNADPSTPLGAYVEGTLKKDPGKVFDYVMSIMESTTNPYYQDATEGAMRKSYLDYRGDFAKDPVAAGSSYYDALRGGQYGGWFGGSQ